MRKRSYVSGVTKDLNNVTQDENPTKRNRAGLPGFQRSKSDGARATTVADYTDENGGIGLPVWLRGADHPLSEWLDGVFEPEGSGARGYSEAVKQHVGTEGMKSLSKDAKARRKRNSCE